MSKLVKVEKYIVLYDEYKELLTDIQRQTFEMYYFDDMSLSEIAESTGTSRPSISEKLKGIEANLDKFESKLHLAEKKEKLSKIINSIDDEELSKKLKEL